MFVTVSTPPQLSAVVGLTKTFVALHEFASEATTTSLAQVMVGFWVSLTVTVKLQVLVRPTASVAVEVTVVVPFGKVDPEAGVELMVTVPGQLSVAVTVNVTTAPHVPGSVDRTIFAGQVIVGGVTSFTRTVNEQVAVLPASSVAVHITVVPPSGNAAGALLVIVTLASQ